MIQTLYVCSMSSNSTVLEFSHGSKYCCSVAKLHLTLCHIMDCSTPGFPVFHYLLEFAQTHVHQVGDAIQPSHPLSSPSPALKIFPRIKIFASELSLPITWPKYWRFSFSISPFNEYSGLISFRIDWFVLFTVQGTLKSLLQPCNLKASILLQSAFFMVQFLHPYMTIGKTRDLIMWSFVSKVKFLLFNKLSVCYSFPSKEQAFF